MEIKNRLHDSEVVCKSNELQTESDVQSLYFLTTGEYSAVFTKKSFGKKRILMFALFFVLSRVHIIIIGHEIFADGKENCNTQHADQGFD